MKNIDVRFCIPRPLQVVIDDVGWWDSVDSRADGNGPSRTACVRPHAVADYAALAQLGRESGSRPLIALVLGEWDTRGILRELPSSTWLGEKWSARSAVAEKCAAAAEILRGSGDCLELALHGICHQYWGNGRVPADPEWYGRDEQCTMHPRAELRRHLEYFARLFIQHQLGAFPTSFVPCNFRYAFGNGENELAGLLKPWGIDLISTPWSSMVQRRRPEGEHFGIDAGIPVIDRDGDEIRWFENDCDPGRCTFDGNTCGLHWPNLLNGDPEKSGENISRWAAALRAVNRRFDRMLARNSADHRAQVIYGELTDAEYTSTELRLNFRKYFALFASHQPEGLVVRFGSRRPLTVGDCHGEPDADGVVEIRLPRTALGSRELVVLPVKPVLSRC